MKCDLEGKKDCGCGNICYERTGIIWQDYELEDCPICNESVVIFGDGKKVYIECQNL